MASQPLGSGGHGRVMVMPVQCRNCDRTRFRRGSDESDGSGESDVGADRSWSLGRTNTQIMISRRQAKLGLHEEKDNLGITCNFDQV